MLVYTQCSTRSKSSAWNNAYIQALFHSFKIKRVEQCFYTSIVPLVPNQARGTTLIYKHCSTRSKSSAWNNAYIQALFHSLILERVEQCLYIALFHSLKIRRVEHCLKTSSVPLVPKSSTQVLRFTFKI